MDFYRRVLGLGIVAERGGGGGDAGVPLGVPGDSAPLVELREQPGAAPVPRAGRLGLYHFAVLLPDRASLGRFVRHLAELGIRAGMADHLVSEAIYLSDPDGLRIEVYADRPRSLWRRRGRELLMTTEPLDLPNLLDAAGGEEWRGAPVGTAIGHVHLSVDDLERADAFYHSALGFDRVVWSYPGALFFSAGGYHHHLGTNVWARDARPAGEGDARLLEWELILPTPGEAAGAVESLSSAGWPPDRGPDGALARDPWGVGVRIRAARAGGPGPG